MNATELERGPVTRADLAEAQLRDLRTRVEEWLALSHSTAERLSGAPRAHHRGSEYALGKVLRLLDGSA